MLDARAKNAYRRRLAEVEDDMEQARAIGDTDGAAQADAERAAMTTPVDVDSPPTQPCISSVRTVLPRERAL